MILTLISSIPVSSNFWWCVIPLVPSSTQSLHCTDNVCNRLWSFERYPNKVLRGLDNAIIYTSNKEACLSACLNEVRSCFLLRCLPPFFPLPPAEASGPTSGCRGRDPLSLHSIDPRSARLRVQRCAKWHQNFCSIQRGKL